MTEVEAKAYVSGRVTPKAFALLERYIDELLAENQRQNMISRSSAETIWARHIADSVQLNRFCNPTGPLLDLGSGPGLPGLILAIMEPERTTHLVESRRRRYEWLEAIADTLALRNVMVHGRALEKIEPFPVCSITARAFAPLPRLLAGAAAFSRSETVWVLPKGSSADRELETVDRACSPLFHVEQSDTNPTAFILVGRGEVAAG